ncbi:MAG: hypothetical protein L3J28_02875 [Candidatus Polarisedimenticolaceae bacterium]|nr:hypothetical protein [Candidatus Polarisedimenticolaceae bacterium]
MSNSDITSHIKSGSKARLIPVVADSKKEERATSVLLSTFMIVPQFAESILAEAGAKIGQRSEIKCYTEVTFNEKEFNGLRPDGLIVISRGKKTWSALVEAKVGNNELNKEQIEKYLDLSKSIGVNALITISNQFATIPTHHPVTVSKHKTRTVDLFHFSWMAVLSKAAIMSSSKSVGDREQAIILKELVRYLNHPYSGVSPMSQMNTEWKDICTHIQQGAALKKNSLECESTVESWQQLFRYIALELSMSTNSQVEVSLTRTHVKYPTAKLHEDIDEIVSQHTLTDELCIPNAASNISVTADFMRRVVVLSMKLEAPKDRSRSTAAINWLTRQLKSIEPKDLIVKAIWPGRVTDTQADLSAVLEDPNVLVPDGMKDIPRFLIVTRVIDLGRKFNGSKVFVESMLSSVPDFYRDVGQHINKWMPRPPKVKSMNNASDADNNGIGDAQKENNNEILDPSGHEDKGVVG